MNRVRISTTVDAERLGLARALAGSTDARLFDRALVLFIEAAEGQREREALAALPYDEDPELLLPPAVALDGLPYDGDVPAAVLRLAEERRRTG